MSQLSGGGQFIPGARGPIFVLVRLPRGPARGHVLVVPPFAEEMNKCRSMITATALALAERGVATIVPDLYGTGDSGGEFAEADWSTWCGDLAQVASWCAHDGHAITGILAIRFGGALAASALVSGAITPVATTVFWQPLFDGKRFLTQFLRLRVAASLAEQDRKESVQDLMARLRAGETVEVAGYELPGQLALDMDSTAAPSSLPGQFGSVRWFEIIREQGAPASAAATQLGERTRAAGVDCVVETLVGEPFWGATEIVRVPALIDATARAFAPSPS